MWKGFSVVVKGGWKKICGALKGLMMLNMVTTLSNQPTYCRLVQGKFFFLNAYCNIQTANMYSIYIYILCIYIHIYIYTYIHIYIYISNNIYGMNIYPGTKLDDSSLPLLRHI